MDVVVVSYRRPDGLDRTLRSLVDQSESDLRILVCDDGSGDATPEVAARWADRDPRIQVLGFTENVGMPGNLNRGLEAVRPPRDVLIAHDGDVYRADAVERLDDALRRWPTAGVAFNQYMTPGTQRAVETYPPYVEGREFLERHFHSRWSFGSPIHGTAAVRSETLRDVGLPRTRFGHLADVDLWLRICERWGVAFVEEPLMTLLPRSAAPQHWGTSSRADRRMTRRIFLESRLRVSRGNARRRAKGLLGHGARTIVHEGYYSLAEATRRLRGG